jgi:hypothetical protein
MVRSESVGKCDVCSGTFSKRQMLRHLSGCAYPPGKDVALVAQIRIDAPSSPFWIDADMKTNAPLRELDRFLRDIWLECCGHLSAFEVGHTRYVLDMSDDIYGPQLNERSMATRISAALPSVGSTFAYEYDFGSTTHLRLKAIAHRHAPTRRDAVRLLARNDAPEWKCSECGRRATSLCAYCIYEHEVFACDQHVNDHECGEEGMVPVVNSPRMGVCGYTGGA